MMIGIFILLGVVALPAVRAGGQSIDVKTVTSTTAAGKDCGLTEAGIKWSETSAGNISIVIEDVATMPVLLASPAFTQCFSPWAYERQVTVEVRMAETKK